MFLKDTFYHLKTLGGLVPGTGSVPRIGASNAGSVLGFAAAVLIENAVARDVPQPASLRDRSTHSTTCRTYGLFGYVPATRGTGCKEKQDIMETHIDSTEHAEADAKCTPCAGFK